MKHKKMWVLLVVFFFFAIIVIAVGYMLFMAAIGFLECDSEKLLPYLEDRYSFSFPSDIANVRSATGNRTLDGCLDFVLKFSIPMDDLETFVHGIGTVSSFDEYKEINDWRLENPSYFTPNWFLKPIPKGKIAEVSVSGTTLKICVDTSDEDRCIVYMKGFYKFSGK